MIDSRPIAWHVLLPEPVNYVAHGCSAPIVAALAGVSTPDAPPVLVVGDIPDQPSADDYDMAVWIKSTPSDVQLRRFAPGTVRQYAALPSLADPRWYVPLDSPHHAGAALDLVSPFRPRARLLKLLLHMSTRLGLMHGFRDRITIASRKPSQLDLFLANTFAEESGSVALAPGRFGDERKLIALVLDRNAAKLAFIKIGFTSEAHKALVNEAEWLRRLSTTCLAPTVPRLLGYHHHGTQTFVAISPGPDRSGPVEMSRLHRDWLLKLQHLDRQDSHFAKSVTALRIRTDWPRIHDSVSPAWQQRIDQATSLLRRDLWTQPLSLAPAHGDFAPWNTRLDRSGQLFVFDWEYARPNCFPLYDAIHFQFMKSITLGDGVLPADVPCWLCKYVAPNSDPNMPTSLLPALFGALLVDLALHHLALLAARDLQEDDLVLKSIAPLLDAQSQWWDRRA